MKYFLQRTSDLVLISKPCARYGRMVPFCFPLKNARNEHPPFESTDPLNLAIDLMKHPAIKMHGPEHHFLVPAVLLAAYYNKTGNPQEKRAKILKARKRAEKILGGFCGTHGVCGAAVGTGIFMSIITNANPLSKKEWNQSNMITAKSLHLIAEHGGPRCCKRNTFLAINEAIEFLNIEGLHSNKNIKCEFSKFNKECLKEKCPFFVK